MLKSAHSYYVFPCYMFPILISRVFEIFCVLGYLKNIYFNYIVFNFKNIFNICQNISTTIINVVIACSFRRRWASLSEDCVPLV